MVSGTIVTGTALLAATASAYKRGLAYNDGIDISGFKSSFIAKSEIEWVYN